MSNQQHIPNNKSLHVKCICYGSMLEIERDNDCGGDDDNFNFVIWSRGIENNTMSWKEKFRWCWNILKTGNPWADSVIVTNQKAQEIAKFILENLPSEEQNENQKRIPK